MSAWGVNSRWGLLLTAAYCLSLILAIRLGEIDGTAIAVAVGLGGVLVTLSLIDIATMTLPDVLTLPLLVAGLIQSTISPGDSDAFLWHSAAAIIGFGSLVALNKAYRHFRNLDGLGRGDAKLFAATGAWLGLSALPSAMLLACLLAIGMIGFGSLAGRPLSSTARIPFGPAISFGFWLTWLFGPLA